MTSEITGLSTEDVQKFQFAVRLSGGDAETAGITIGIFEKNIAEASSGAGTAAQAFSNMGISIKDDITGATRPAIDILGDLADVFPRVTDANLRAEYARALFGRGYQSLLAILLQGREGLKELNTQLDETGAKMSPEMVEKTDELAKHTKVMGSAWDGFAHTIENAVLPAYDGLIQKSTAALESATKWMNFFQSMPKMSEASERIHANDGWQGSSGNFDGWQGSSGSIAGSKDYGTQFGPPTPIKLAPLKSPGAGKAGGDEDDGELDYLKNLYTTQIALSHTAFEQVQQDQKGLLDSKKESAADELEAVKAAAELEYQAIQGSLDQEASLYDKDSVEFAQVQNKKALAAAQYGLEMSRVDTEIARAQQEAAKQNEQTFKAATDLISRDLDTMLTGILQGTESLQEALAKVFENIAVSFVEAVIKMMVQWAAFEVLTQGFGVAGLVNPMSGGFGGVVAGALGIKSYDVGSWSIPSDQMAFVHAGEMILPEQQASAIRSGNASLGASSGTSGGQFNITIQASIRRVAHNF